MLYLGAFFFTTFWSKMRIFLSMSSNLFSSVSYRHGWRLNRHASLLFCWVSRNRLFLAFWIFSIHLLEPLFFYWGLRGFVPEFGYSKTEWNWYSKIFIRGWKGLKNWWTERNIEDLFYLVKLCGGINSKRKLPWWNLYGHTKIIWW